MRVVAASLLAAALAVGAAAQQQPPAQAPATHLKVGDKAPEFSMRDQDRKQVKLSDFKGKTVVLAFYVLAFTGG
jgi:cytochrome oxidase Cu insertion factor (SCO1/SenC/PrrC family)